MLIRPQTPHRSVRTVHRAAPPTQASHQAALAPQEGGHAPSALPPQRAQHGEATSEPQRAAVVDSMAGWVRSGRVQPTPESKAGAPPATVSATTAEPGQAAAEERPSPRQGQGLHAAVCGVASQLSQLGDRARDYVAEKSGLKPNQEEKAHMQAIHDMLAKDRLGGQDTTFNQNDIDAVARSIGGGGLSGKVVSGIAARRMREGLAEQGIKPAQAQADATPRKVSRADMERFQENLKGFEAYGKRVGQNPLGRMLGLDRPKVPPHGLSQEDMQAILRGQQPKGWVDPKDLR